MARKPTTFSKVSTGYNDSVNTVGESGYDLGFIDGYGTNLTLTGNIATGGGATITAISSATEEVDFGSITSLAADSKITMALSGATNGDTLIVNVDSEWSGYDAVSLMATSGDTTGEINIIPICSGITAVDPTAVVIRATRIGWSTYV